MDEWRYNSAILDLSTAGRSRPVTSTLPGIKIPRLPLETQTGWAPKSVWTLRAKTIFLVSVKNRTPEVQQYNRCYVSKPQNL
jgi:hypothetical protein